MRTGEKEEREVVLPDGKGKEVVSFLLHSRDVAEVDGAPL